MWERAHAPVSAGNRVVLRLSAFYFTIITVNGAAPIPWRY